MKRLAAGAGLLISGYYIVTIVTHAVRPGANTGYTRMLMFVCLATIPLGFMMAMIGGRDRLPLLASKAKEMLRGGPASVLLLIGLVVLLVLMPAGMLAGIWSGLGLRSGALFALYFVPVIARLALAPALVSVQSAVVQGVLLFASFFTGMGIVYLLDLLGYGAAAYEEHVQVIWPGYGSAAVMFFSVCAFTFLNQAVEFGYAARGILGRRQERRPSPVSS